MERQLLFSEVVSCQWESAVGSTYCARVISADSATNHASECNNTTGNVLVSLRDPFLVYIF